MKMSSTSLTKLLVSEAAASNFLKLKRNVAFFRFRLFNWEFPWKFQLWKQPFTSLMKMATLKIFSVTFLVESNFRKVEGQETPNIIKMEFAIDIFLEVFTNFRNRLFDSISLPLTTYHGGVYRTKHLRSTRS